MSFNIAFYKGPETFFGRLIRWWDKGPYSHCELVFSDGAWATAFWTSGVVIWQRDGNPASWDFIELADHLEPAARAWFEAHKGKSYDFVGLLRFVFDFLSPSRDKWFCSRACADALGLADGWRDGPNGLHAEILNVMGGSREL